MSFAARWILFFHRTAAGKAVRRKGPRFEQFGDVPVERAFRYEGDAVARDLFLAPESEQKPPFDPTSKQFVRAFERVIQDPQVKALLDDDNEQGDWYAERVETMRTFWRLMKKEWRST